MSYILALDQGTTSSRTFLYNLSGQVIASSAYEYQVSHPHPNWVEQNPLEIWQTQLRSLTDVLCKIDPRNVIALGLTNQRETVIAWNRLTGEPLAPAIVWQCKRTAEYCLKLKSSNWNQTIADKTGLTIDPYFSASKIRWLLQNNPKVQSAYQKEECVFGTVDSWLIYQLTKDNQAQFLTDASNASRTMLYNIIDHQWDPELLKLFEINQSALCQVRPSNSNFGTTKILGLNTPITGVLGDQQSSLLGHQGINNGDLKCTFGTGAFLLQNSGQKPTHSNNGLITTIAWQLEEDGKRETTYALEGSVFIAGSLIKWLRDKIKIISSSEQVESLAIESNSSNGLIIIPAFSGLGAPIWDPDACGAMFGISADTSQSDIAYASLEAVAHQIADLLSLPELENSTELSIDGGMVKNNLFNQVLSDLTQRKILVPDNSEATVYGAFLIAAYGAKISNPFSLKTLAPSAKSYSPQLSLIDHQTKRANWQKAISRARSWYNSVL